MTYQTKVKVSNFFFLLGNTAHRLLQPFGISYLISYILKYPIRHDISNFCGNLVLIMRDYSHADKNKRAELTNRFVNIIDALVLRNGVRKTTYSGRQNVALSLICKNTDLSINRRSIRVLDLPSSVGLASVDMYEMLKKSYSIDSYTLADRYFEVLYDQERNCIYDDTGDLLQVGFRKYFFSIYRPHNAGNVFGIIAKLFLFPMEIISAVLRKKFRFQNTKENNRILLLHPEALSKVEQGVFDLLNADIFKEIQGRYDLILSFNLLQKNYFSDKQINIGINNLVEVLDDEGMLVMGNTESYTIKRKTAGKMVTLMSVGNF